MRQSLCGHRVNAGRCFEGCRHLCRSTTHHFKLCRGKQIRGNAADRDIAWVVAKSHRDLVPAKERRCGWENDNPALLLREGKVGRPCQECPSDRKCVDETQPGVHARAMRNPGGVNQINRCKKAKSEADAEDATAVRKAHGPDGKADKQK